MKLRPAVSRILAKQILRVKNISNVFCISYISCSGLPVKDFLAESLACKSKTCTQKTQTSSSYSSPYGFSLFRGRHSESPFSILSYFLYLLLLTPTTCMSSLIASINLLFGRPLGLIPGSSISSILLPMSPLSLFCTCPNHLNLASLALYPNTENSDILHINA